jgi:hypothetical protein
MVYYIPADKFELSSGIVITSLLSGIAFQLAISSNLPDIGYIIYIDKIFYMSYFLIAITMMRSLINFYLDKSGDEKKIKLGNRLDIFFRILFPVLFFGSFLVFA